jgi:hypothetical protein
LAVGGGDEVGLEKVCSLEDPRQDTPTGTFTFQGNTGTMKQGYKSLSLGREYKAHSIRIDKARAKDKMYMSVGVMKDYKLKLRILCASHTL